MPRFRAMLSIHTSINYTYIAISNSISENWILGDEHLAHCCILLRGRPLCVPKDAESNHVDHFNPHLFGDGSLFNGICGLPRKLVRQLVGMEPCGRCSWLYFTATVGLYVDEQKSYVESLHSTYMQAYCKRPTIKWLVFSV